MKASEFFRLSQYHMARVIDAKDVFESDPAFIGHKDRGAVPPGWRYTANALIDITLFGTRELELGYHNKCAVVNYLTEPFGGFGGPRHEVARLPITPEMEVEELLGWCRRVGAMHGGERG